MEHKTDLILKHFAKGKSLTALEALKLYGTMRLGAYVHRMQNRFALLFVRETLYGKDKREHYTRYKLNARSQQVAKEVVKRRGL